MLTELNTRFLSLPSNRGWSRNSVLTFTNLDRTLKLPVPLWVPLLQYKLLQVRDSLGPNSLKKRWNPFRMVKHITSQLNVLLSDLSLVSRSPAPMCPGHLRTATHGHPGPPFITVLGVSFLSPQHQAPFSTSSFFLHVSHVLPLLRIPQHLPEEGRIGDKFLRT